MNGDAVPDLGAHVKLFRVAKGHTRELYIACLNGPFLDSLEGLREALPHDILSVIARPSLQLQPVIDWARLQGYYVRAILSSDSAASSLFLRYSTIPMLVNMKADTSVAKEMAANQDVLSFCAKQDLSYILPECNRQGAKLEIVVADEMQQWEITQKIAAWLSEEAIKARFQRRSKKLTSLRWKYAEGVANFRDAAMEHFPQDLLYRSADLSGLTEKGLPQLARYVHTIIDVRSMPEVKRNGTIGPLERPFSDEQLAKHGIVRRHVPIFRETDYSPEAIAHRHGLYKNGSDGFVEAYRGILEHCDPALNSILTALIHKSIQQNERRGVLVHCSAGKDRTGILCALVLLYAGVSAEAVASEYELTSLGLADKKRAILESLSRPGADLGSQAQIESMMGSPKIVMLKSIAVMEAEFSGVQAIVKRSGVSEADLAVFRAYTAEQPSVKL